LSSSHQQFAPYANEADVLHLGSLMIENRTDRVTLSGDLDLTADQEGLAQARALHALLASVIAALEKSDLPATLPAPASKHIDNPF
jgi:hypothetical protein